jgi:pimeloyl-ACP methyl ester carboxylesterase
MVSFDPRGVGWSGPKVTCAPGNNTALEARTTVDEFRKAFEAQAKINHACNEANKDTDAKYVGTSAVVQDMMHFVELQAAAKGKKPEEALINYYGISYGTVVGQTLAQMYPDRLRRVLLDANVNSVGHYQGWEPSGLDDLAHSIWMFSNFCFEAGPEWCALAEGKSSTKEIQYRFDRVLAQLENEPLITSKFPVGRVEFFTAAQQLLYHPRNDEGYNKLINLTIAAETRDVAAMEEVLGKALKGLSRRETPTPSGHEQRIITAVDIAGRYPWKNFEDWFAAVERIEAPYGGPNYAVGNG